MTAPILHKPARKTYTLAQFLEMEMRSDVRHEFHNGKIINMPGGTLTHNLIGTRITTLLNNFIDSQKKDLYVFGSDQMCYIEAQNKVLYP